MTTANRSLAIFFGILATLGFAAMFVTGLTLIGMGPSIPVQMMALMVAGWVVFIFFGYRAARQEELLHVLTTSIEAGVPLAKSLQVYLRDRPQGLLYRFFVACGQHAFVFPLYYWIWHKGRSFDDRIAKLAERLEQGETLATALHEMLALANREVRIAAAVGERSNKLVECLRNGDRKRTASVVMELVPRIVYPMLLLTFVYVLTGYHMTMVLPKMKRIFDDFKVPLPRPTTLMIDWWQSTLVYLPLIVLALGVLAFAFSVFVASPTVRWHFPLIGRIFRWSQQGLCLRMLASLFDIQLTAPQALDMLAETPDTPEVVRVRLKRTSVDIERGYSLAASLAQHQLLPKTMAPLIDTAQRTQTLPWALREMGDLLADRAVGLTNRLSMLISPFAIVAVGVVVFVVILGIFVPLIDLLNRFH